MMTPERWRAAEELYDKARGAGADGRAALLEGVDPETRSVVLRMLESAEGEDSPTRTVAGGGLIGPYLLGEVLGSGGMGVVYSATDTRLDRRVAIKIGAARYSDRFQREAKAIATLNHPHVCTLYDVGPDYLVMEFIEGSTLADEIGKGPLAPETALLYGSQIAAALAEAHGRGVIHRDLKPRNVMVTRHGVKVLDFGLAKILSDARLTEAHAVMGTPAYMSPEQVEGREPTESTDLFALGLVLYEMLTGKLPAPGASLGKMLATGAISPDKIPAPSLIGAHVTPETDELIAKLLARDPARRLSSAAEAATLLLKAATPAPTVNRKYARPVYAVPALIVLLVAGSVGGVLFRRSAQERWVRDEALPQVAKLAGTRPLAAYLLLKKAGGILPGDPAVSAAGESLLLTSTIDSAPTGGEIAMQDYTAPNDPWYTVGKTPLKNVSLPKGYFRWKISQTGAGELVLGANTRPAMKFSLPDSQTPVGMVPVPAGSFANIVGFIGLVSYPLPAFDIDMYEVTNAQYQEFVDQGGYRRPEFWKEKFVNKGNSLSWNQAMELFHDSTGRAGPSTWEAGRFPPGHGDYPVSGISWYEASAYAQFRGRSLPVMGQWYKASPQDGVSSRMQLSNFNGRGPIAVQSSGGVGPYGTFGMGGNVREWCQSADDHGDRFILGGAWGTQNYQAYDPEALSPFDRSAFNGARCVRNRAPLTEKALAPVVSYSRDFAKAKPVSDEVFRAYQMQYAYAPTPVNRRKEGPDEAGPYWTREKLSIEVTGAYERLPLYLYIPKKVRPPYQAVVFYPSARVNSMPSSDKPGDMEFVDYVIKSGRALAYPIYEGMYERNHKRTAPGAFGQLDRIVQNSREVRRVMDFLGTRPDIDSASIAYLGVSQGTAEGVIYTALEDRFKAVVFLDGGFFLNEHLPARDQVNFAPRLKKPVLMVNGRYDYTFPAERSQEPLFRMLGTPAADKRRVVFDTPHDVSQRPAELSREVLAWLDRYLGKVKE